MEFYRQYLKEREGMELLSTDKGFVVYNRQPDGDFYIRDIYVAPDFRKTGVAREMADRICDEAKAHGAKKIYGSVAPTATAASASMQVLLSYGMRFVHVHAQLGLLIFEKDL